MVVVGDVEAQGAVGKPANQPRVSPISGTAPPVEHQWKPGQSGNPRGGWENGPPGPAFERALRKAVLTRPDLVEAAVMKALEGAADGDIKALAQLWDRDAGKAKQSVEHSGSVTNVTLKGT